MLHPLCVTCSSSVGLQCLQNPDIDAVKTVELPTKITGFGLGNNFIAVVQIFADMNNMAKVV